MLEFGLPIRAGVCMAACAGYSGQVPSATGPQVVPRCQVDVLGSGAQKLHGAQEPCRGRAAEVGEHSGRPAKLVAARPGRLLTRCPAPSCDVRGRAPPAGRIEDARLVVARSAGSPAGQAAQAVQGPVGRGAHARWLKNSDIGSAGKANAAPRIVDDCGFSGRGGTGFEPCDSSSESQANADSQRCGDG